MRMAGQRAVVSQWPTRARPSVCEAPLDAAVIKNILQRREQARQRTGETTWADDGRDGINGYWA